jgi:CheY-like chemotaxis protein
MNGYQVLRALKAEAALQAALVVAVTSYAEEEDKQRTAQAGFDAHFVKPITIESVRELIGRLRTEVRIVAPRKTP